jgi:hypothetical protein
MISDGKSRWLAGVLTVLGGSVFLSGCSTAAPTAPDSALAADLGSPEAGRVSALSSSTALVYCPRCYWLIDPVRVPGNSEITAFLSMTNEGTEPVGNVHVTGYLLGANRERVRVAEIDQAGPRPRQAVSFTVRFEVPSELPPGPCRVEMVFDPEDPALPSYTWVSDQIVTVP